MMNCIRDQTRSDVELKLDQRVETYITDMKSIQVWTTRVWICIWTVDMMIDGKAIMTTRGPQRRSVAELESMGAACLMRCCPGVLGIYHPYYMNKYANLERGYTLHSNLHTKMSFDCRHDRGGSCTAFQRDFLDVMLESANVMYGDTDPVTSVKSDEPILHVLDYRF